MIIREINQPIAALVHLKIICTPDTDPNTDLLFQLL